ncbi:MAG: hypothetical protein ABI488_13155 [Polyangiaceae bacterium]
MQDANDQHLAVQTYSEEDSVLAHERAKVGRNLMKRPTELRSVNDSLKSGKEPYQVPLGVILTPSVCRERANVEQVGARPAQ